MQDIFTLVGRYGRRTRQAFSRLMAAVMLALVAGQNALAALPAQRAPQNNPQAGDWLGLIQGYAKDAFQVLGLILGAAAFIWLAWGLIAKFNEARAGKAEWGTVGLYAVGAGGVAVLDVYLLNTAIGII